MSAAGAARSRRRTSWSSQRITTEVHFGDTACTSTPAVGGRVVEVGTHDQPIAQGGLYAELFTIPASSYVDTA